jgi:hypothetical protein
VFNPYVRWFYVTTSGSSPVVMGDTGDTYYFEFGATPTIDMKKYWPLPVTFPVPTWFSVGPTDFWNRNDGTTNFCGPTRSA